MMIQPITCDAALHHSIRVNLCWSSPARLFLVLDPIATHDQIFVCSEIIYVFGNGTSSSRRGEGVSETFVAPQFSTSVPALTEHPSKSIYTLWTQYAFCDVTIMNNIYIRNEPG
jgi:hypothetical protein